MLSAHVNSRSCNVGAADFSGSQALAEWIVRNDHLFCFPPPAQNAVWVNVCELLTWSQDFLPTTSPKLPFAFFMRQLHSNGWLVRADPACCPDIQCVRAVVCKCRSYKLRNHDVMDYALCAALLRSPTKMPAMADTRCPNAPRNRTKHKQH